jgi:hypothetical protein
LKDFDKDTNDNRYGVEYTEKKQKNKKEEVKEETLITVISYGEKKEKK